MTGEVWTPPSSAIATAKVAIALAGAALAAADLALARRGRDAVLRRVRLVAWVALALAALLAWTRLGPFAGVRKLHVWELYHHVLGAKYFAELGYVRLYDCTLVADAEAGFEFAPAERPVRRLATNRVVRGDTFLAEAQADCASRFTPARWREFAHDVAVFRNRALPRTWGRLLTDHGFNASPVWTLGGSAITHFVPVSGRTLSVFATFDQVLLALMTVALAWGFGLRVAAMAWIALGTLYLADFSWLGGAFLRYDWLALAAIGVASVRRGRLAAGGFALTWATAVRIFPGFLVAAVVLHAALDLARRRSLALAPPHRRFALGCLLAIATLGPLSVALEGWDAWPGFVANSRKHLSTPLVNFAGWKTVVAFDPAATSAALQDPKLDDPFERWQQSVRAHQDRRYAVYVAGVAVFAVLLAAALARTPLAWAPLLGIGLTVVAAELGAYYYALLALYAGLVERIPLAGVVLLLFAAASHGVASAIGGSQDVVFAALSALSVALAVALTAMALRQRPDAPTRP
jgi:hypothetical protein